jgi:hypothetical protein
MMAQYAALVENNPDLQHIIMSDKHAWAKEIQNCKMWVPISFIPHFNGINEFGSSRGAIYAHMIGCLVSHPNAAIDSILANWAEQAYFQSVFHYDAVSNTDVDNELVEQANAALEKQLQLSKSEVTEHLGVVYTSEFGLTIVHPVMAPSELVKPAGHNITMGYRNVHDDMFTWRNVLVTNEIHFLKFERKTDLYCGSVNLTNHVFCHGFSTYCWNLDGNQLEPF